MNTMSDKGAGIWSPVFWSVECLLNTPEKVVPTDALSGFLDRISWDSMSECPMALRCRLLLRKLQYQNVVNKDTLEALNGLVSLISVWGTSDTGSLQNMAPHNILQMMPGMDMILAVKTLLVYDVWDQEDALTNAEACSQVFEIFGPNFPSEHQNRFEACLAATKYGTNKDEIRTIAKAPSVLASIHSYVDLCLRTLGVPVLEAVYEDIASGKYRVGVTHSLNGRNFVENVSDLAGVTQGIEEARSDGRGPALPLEQVHAERLKNAFDGSASSHQALLDALGSTTEMMLLGNQQQVNIFTKMPQNYTGHMQCIERESLDILNQIKNKNGKRRANRRWSDEEVAALKEGLIRFGAGSWARILKEYIHVLGNRTQVDLKDKWRNLTRKTDDEEIQKILANSGGFSPKSK
jgi:hypothetical protein